MIGRRISKMRQFSSFETLGLWKFPRSRRSVTGTLTHTENGSITLRIIMKTPNLRTAKKVPFQGVEKSEHSVRGILETGEFALLRNLWLTEVSDISTVSDDSKVTVALYSVSYMFVGDYKYERNQKIDRVAFEYDVLDTWLNSELRRNIEIKEEAKQTVITHIKPTPIVLRIPGDFTAQLGYGHGMALKQSSDVFTLSQSVALVIAPKKPLGVDKLREKAKWFEYFLMLATGTKVQPKSIAPVQKEYKLFALFGERRTYSDAIDEWKTRTRFEYSLIKEIFDRVMIDWFEFVKKYQHATKIYFEACLIEQSLSPEIIFLCKAQALEALDRVHNPNGGLRDSLVMVLDSVHSIWNSGTDNAEFIEKVVCARNYYSHGYTSKPNCEPPPVDELLVLTKTLDLLICVYMIKNLKMSNDLESEIISDVGSWPWKRTQ